MLLHSLWIFPESVLIDCKLAYMSRKSSTLTFNYVTEELKKNSRCTRFSVTDVLMFKILQFNNYNLLNE